MRPPSGPRRSASVCRSARIWQGWNSSVSALITGTADASASSIDPLLAGGAPDDRRRLPGEHPGDVADRLAAADVRGLRVDDERGAAELGDADGERDAGAQRWLVEEDGDGPRARQRAAAEPVLLHRRGQGEHLGLLGRGEVVVAEEVPVAIGYLSPWARVRMAGRAATNSSASAWVRIERRGEPHRVRLDGVDEEARLPGGGVDVGRLVLGEDGGEPEAAAADAREQRVVDRLDAVGQRLADRLDVLEQVVASRSCRGRRGRRRRRSGCRRRWSRGRRRERGGASPKPTQAPIGRPPPRPLASVITSGVTPSAWWANHAPVRPMPDWISSSTSSAPASSQAARAAAR